MEVIYTREGLPLKVNGDDLFARSGQHVARLSRGRKKAYGSDGKYVGTLVGDRLIYRSVDRAAIGPSFAKRAGQPHALVKHARTALWGDEPSLAD